MSKKINLSTSTKSIDETIQTVANELNRSYEFVRVRTDDGKIKYIKLGATKMIPRGEFIKLLTKGV